MDEELIATQFSKLMAKIVRVQVDALFSSNQDRLV